MGCFWCSENLFLKKQGVFSTQVGYALGKLPHPTYEDVCTGQTGHSEVLRIIFDPQQLKYEEILKIFWAYHDSTTLNQQGGDCGTQYRSGIYYYDSKQKELAESTRDEFQKVLDTE